MPKIKAAYGQYMAAAIEQGTLDASSCQLGEELELELPPLEELPKNIAQLIVEGRNADSMFSGFTFVDRRSRRVWRTTWRTSG